MSASGSADPYCMDDISTLTQFPTPTSDRPQQTSLLSRFFSKRKEPSNPVQLRREPSGSAAGRVSSIHVSVDNSTFYESSQSCSATQEVEHKKGGAKGKTELRTLGNVLGKIMHLVEKKSAMQDGLKSYEDSDFRQSWMPDSSCKQCYECGNKFSTFVRRHHCRICGQIFCSRCCNQEVPGTLLGFEGGLRACRYCCDVVLKCLNRVEDSNDLGLLHKDLQEQLDSNSLDQTITPLHNQRPSIVPVRRFSSSEDSFDVGLSHVFDRVPTPEPVEEVSSEERQLLLEDSVELRSLLFELLHPQTGLPLTSKRHKIRNYHECFYGYELTTWLTDSDKVKHSNQAEVIGQALLDAHYIICLTSPSSKPFHSDYTIYKLRDLTSSELTRRYNTSMSADEPNWVQELEMEGSNELSSTIGTNLIFDSSSVTMPANIHPQTFLLTGDSHDTRSSSPSSNRSRHASGDIHGKDDFSSGVVVPLANSQMEDENDESLSEETITNENNNLIADQFRAHYDAHLKTICLQLLNRKKLPLTWEALLINLSTQIHRFVRPDGRYVSLDSRLRCIDIRNFVHMKKIRSGSSDQSEMIWGVVCTKSVIHKNMKQMIKQPQIMLLKSSIEYQRVCNKLTTLEPLILQEQEYLRNCVDRIIKYKPDVLLVENDVSRVAQDMLYEAGITVAINVKSSVMNRICRLTQCDIIPNIDSLLSPPNLGTCYKFYTHTYRFTDGHFKTVMVFNGCPANLGCTVLLRDESYQHLIKVKDILQTLIYTCHHGRLEMSYLLDQSAQLNTADHLPSPGSDSNKSQSVKLSDGKIKSERDEDLTGVDEGIVITAPPAETRSSFETSSERFRSVLKSVELDVSPFVQVKPPYLETVQGDQCELRRFFQTQQYFSPLLVNEEDTADICNSSDLMKNEGFDHRINNLNMRSECTEVTEPHPFITWTIERPANNRTFKDMMTSYRGYGARILLKNYRFIQSNSIFNQSKDEDKIDVTEAKQPDCFDLDEHQQISVLFSCYPSSPNNQLQPCIKPWLVNMEFYDRNDLHLGYFLEYLCFREEYTCSNYDICQTAMINHIRRFVYGGACLDLIMVKPQIPEINNQNNKNMIHTWSWCRICKKATPVTRLSPMAWNLSFAKYIQLRMTCTLVGCQAIPECTHSISQDYYQYFRLADKVTTFKYQTIKLRHVEFPPPSVEVKHDITSEEIHQRVKRVYTTGMKIYSEVSGIFHKLESLGVDTETKKQVLSTHRTDLETEKAWFISETDSVQRELVGGSSAKLNEKDVSKLYSLQDDLIKLKKHLARSTMTWNNRITAFLNKEDKKLRHADRKQNSSNLGADKNSPATLSVKQKLKRALSEYGFGSDNVDDMSAAAAFPSREDTDGPVSSTNTRYDINTIDSLISTDHIYGTDIGGITSAGYDDLSMQEYVQSVNAGLEAAVEPPRIHASSTDSYVICSNEPEDSPTTPKEELVLVVDDTILPVDDYFMVSNEDSENSERIERENSTDSKQRDSKTSLDVFDDSSTHKLSPASSETLSGTSPRDVALRHPANATSDSNVTHHHKSMRKQTGKAFIDTIKAAVMHPAAELTNVEHPFSDNEHYLLWPTIGAPVVIYDQEPSSIIAYTLGSEQYDQELIELSKQIMLKRSVRSDSTIPLPEKDDYPTQYQIEHALKQTSISSITAAYKYRSEVVSSSSLLTLNSNQESSQNLTEIATEFADDVDAQRFGRNKSSAQSELLDQHIELEFSENSECKERQAMFYCKVFYALDFKKFRKKFFPQGEQDYIRSLSRCFKWHAKGGKSGLGFCKSRDERFIIKEMSSKEIQSFVQFAPRYFKYMYDTYSTEESNSKPGNVSALAKIFGVYRVSFKNFLTGQAMKQDVLVIENLFYNRKISKMFDLKGSERNRLVKKYDAADSVLLDENFKRYAKHNPIYVRQHTKTVLSDTLSRDTQFLSSHTVMDYSLLCGFDEDKQSMVVGIIDYIRTFTWDKKVETVLKAAVGGQAKPTIISPERYRNRFLDAMESYFNVVPDRWTDFAKENC